MVARVTSFIVCGDQSPPSTTALGFVERFKSLPSGQRHEALKTGTVGTVAAEYVDGFKPLDAALNATSELTAAGTSPTRTQAHHRGAGESHR